jgi:hypothetical protein
VISPRIGPAVGNSYLAVASPAQNPTRGNCRAIFAVATAISSLWIWASAAHAQGMTDRVDRADRPDLRGEIDGKASSEKPAEKDITIGVELPARHSSSVTSASVDSIVEDRPDRHVTPDLYLKWAHQYDWFKASAEIGASIDRYFNTSDANLDSLHTSFKFAKTDGKREYFVPYFSVSTEMFFLPTFKQPDITYHDVAIGFYSGLAWRDKELIPYMDSLIPYSDAAEPGDVSILFDARLGRRMSDTTSYQNTFLMGRITAAYFISSNWRVEAGASLRARWYEDYHGERRSDLRPSATVGLMWSPDWLKKIVKRSELSFNMEFYQNRSNIADKNYSLWEVGPTLSLRTKF